MPELDVIYKFERAPVNETVLGVQFDPLAELRYAHLGAFWYTLGDQWPSLTEVAEIEQQFERFGDNAQWEELGIRLRISQSPGIRLQARRADGQRMIQLQNGRLHYNWLRGNPQPAGGSYPHYPEIRNEFNHLNERFLDFIKTKNLGEMKFNQWEVTYVNHLPKGSVWNTPADWSSLFCQLPGIRGSPNSPVTLESLSSEWHFEIPPKRGRLHVHLRHGLSDNVEVLILTLTARGPVRDGLQQGLNLGREVIVRTFKEITSESAHHYWGLIK
jgi:uncharacterized protein (TIGR04255 family)